MSGVDVLAVLEHAFISLRIDGRVSESDQIDLARAAVAELIEAANAVSESCTRHYGHSMLLHLDVAASGGKNERLRAALSRVRGAE